MSPQVDVLRRFTRRTVLLLATSFAFSLLAFLVGYRKKWFWWQRDRIAETVAPLRIEVPLVAPEDVTKTTLSPDEFKNWYRQLLNWMEFNLLNKSDTLEGMRRIQQYKDLIWQSAQQYNLDPYWLMGLLLVESNGDPDAAPGEDKDSTAKGIAQFIIRTGRENGLKIEFEDVYNWVEPPPIKGKKKPKIKPKKIWVKVGEKCCSVDERLDPAKAIPAAARLLRRYINKFKDPQFAALAYHSGEGATDKVLAYFGNPNMKNYAQLFFVVHPLKHAECYNHLFNLRDDGVNYPFKVERAAELLRIYDGGKGEELIKRLAQYHRVPEFGVTKNRFWVWYPKVPTFNSIVHIKKAIEVGFLVKLDDREYPGLSLQTKPVEKDASFIGSFHPDVSERAVFAAAKPETAGMLILFGKLLTAVQKEGGKKDLWSALITSLVTYGIDPRIEHRRWPLHADGTAVDLWQGKTAVLTQEQINTQRFVLWRMNMWGYLAHDREEVEIIKEVVNKDGKKEDKKFKITLRWYLVPNPGNQYKKIFFEAYNASHPQVPGPGEARVRTVQEGGS